MLDLTDYEPAQPIYTGNRTLVYRTRSKSNGQPVVIKVLRNPHPSFNELVNFRNQYVLAHHLESPKIVRPLALERYENGYALIMPDDGSVALPEYWPSSPHSLEEFFDLALQLADVLHDLARERVIHKDIKPANILIHPDSKKIRLIDFSIASLLPKEQEQLISPNVLEGTLAYLSPEQTGRMNRGLDYRTDFYSLGATFFELLTGQLPFQSTEPLELVHCHIAKPVEFPSEVRIPPTLQNIVLKLMAKNAEDRYQSALGLKFDLECCRQQWLKTGTIEAFELGQRDLCDRFTIPEKLYGREQEVAQLLAAFDRVCGRGGDGTSTSLGASSDQGTGREGDGEQNRQSKINERRSEIVLVAGFSGVGKTAVVNEVHKPITRQKGYFIKGKFDQFNRNLPLSAFVQAFRTLMLQLLCEPDEKLQAWRAKILAVTGNSGQVLIDVIPELESIIGSQPAAPELSGVAAQNRFNLLFQNFVAAFATAEHPLVIFLDDLQWADSASLQLIKLLAEERSHLLLLGAYRDNEVSPVHPFIATIRELEKAGKKVNTIVLNPLSENTANQLIAETLHCPRDRAQPLTEILYRQTQGNPFFLTQFLKALSNDGSLQFNRDCGYWECDLTRVNTLSLTADVVEFLAAQLQKLPADTQTVLKLAACIGTQFDLETLAIVCDRTPTETATALWKALQEGLIVPISKIYKFYQQSPELETQQPEQTVTYQFLHDRVQQAAYSLIPQADKKSTHYRLGKLLLEKIPPAVREERIFDLVNQLNYGAEEILQQSERDELAGLELIACRKARSSTAYKAGREYATIGLSLLGEEAWERQYAMTLELYELAVEFALLCGDFEAMERDFQKVIERVETFLDGTKVYRTKIVGAISQFRLAEAIAIGLEFLEHLNVRFPEFPTPEAIQQEAIEIEQLIGDRQIEDLVELPDMSDREKIAILDIANSILPPAGITNAPVMPFLSSLSVKLSIQYGNTLTSTQAYALYGMLSCNFLRQIERGVQFGKLALKVLAKLDAKAIKPEVLTAVSFFIFHRQIPLQETLPLLQDAHTAALEVGNLQFVGFSAQHYCLNAFWSGQPLTTLHQKVMAYCEELTQLNQLTTANWARIDGQAMANLLGEAENPNLLSGAMFEESELLPQLRAAGDAYALYLIYLYKMMLAYLFGALELARESAVGARQHLRGANGCIAEPAFYFYDSLIALASLEGATEAEIAAAIERVTENQKSLQFWARYAPQNHQHKVDLVMAEQYRVLGQKIEAIEFYERASAGAREHEFIQEEALSNELAAKFYLAWGFDFAQPNGMEKSAIGYLQEAYYGYARWGAKAKTDDLEKRYPNLLRPMLQSAAFNLSSLETLTATTQSDSIRITATQTTHSSSNTLNTVLDFTSTLKAAQSLARTIQLEDLLQQLTQIILQHSGGDRCALILPNSAGEWQVRAIATLKATVLYATALDDVTDLPVGLIQYVKRTGETLVIDNLETDLPVIDAELSERNPQSILCLPLLNLGETIGLLYLENQATANAFTRDRLLVLNFLCSQAAIALENASLYQQARDYAQQLEQSQLQIVQSEKMASLGNLVAGVAHEINNPLGFLTGSLENAKGYTGDLIEHLELYQHNNPTVAPEIQEHAEEIDLEFMEKDFPKLLAAMGSAVERIRSISTSLRTFSRADRDHPIAANLHDGIDSALLILKYRLKANENRPAIAIVKDYGQLPEVECFPGQLNQVFMNLLANAIDALDEGAGKRSYSELEADPQQIAIATAFLAVEKTVEIRIRDNGGGIPPELQAKIFEHLFTTKGVGKGTGLGLAIARQIVEEKHDGTLAMSSELGRGTEFCIRLPVRER